MAWNEGYVTEVEYTFGYYQELDPRRAAYALNVAGYHAPPMTHACELGYGNGLSVVMHAASQPGTEFCGTDFNPTQASLAQSLTKAFGGTTQLFDQSFEEFCGREDLPEFDYISLHGIWTWVSEANKHIIVDFIRRKLKVGGVLYISYNTLPGWSNMMSARHLMNRHNERMGQPGVPITVRADAAIGFLEQMLATNPKYLQANPIVAQRIEQMKAHDRSYIAHEYLNRDWTPMHFAEMEAWLEPAKVSYATSAHLMETIDVVNFTADQQKLLHSITDRSFKETVRDYLYNQQFRRDLWVKGARRMTGLEQVETLRKNRFVLKQQRSSVKMKITGLLGEADLHAEVYTPILDLMADHKVRSFAEIERDMVAKGLNYAQVSSAINILVAQGSLYRALEDDEIARAKKTTTKLNDWLIRRARGAADLNYVASPVIGAALPVNRVGQLALLAMKEGRKTPAEWAKFTWDILTAQGQKLVKEGVTLETPEENLAELTAQMDAFAKENVPIIKALGVI